MARDPEKRTDLREILLTNIIVLTFSIIGGLIAIQGAIPPAHLVYFLYVSFGLCMFSLILVYLNIMTRQFIRIKREAELTQMVLNALPTFYRMTRRQDRFVVGDTGSVTLHWDFDLEMDLEEPLRDILFPVFAECHKPGEGHGSAVVIDTLTVNGRSENVGHCYSPKQIRAPFHGVTGGNEPSMEFGILKVPVDFVRGKGRCSIAVQMTIHNAFPNVLSKEFVIVDIPSITERLEVIIEGSAGYLVRPSDLVDDTILATVSTVEFRDLAETHKQNRNWQVKNDSIVWNCEFPKIGYRYLVFFRIEQPPNAKN
jgi:hypothetical protein